MAAPTKAYLTVRAQAELALGNDVPGYLALGYDESCLDGYFTSAHLRRIADAMDLLAQTPEAREQAELDAAHLARIRAERQD